MCSKYCSNIICLYKWVILRFVLLSLAITGYYLYPNQYTKTLPALVLIPLSSVSILRSAFLFAAFGDYYLDMAPKISEFWIPGILSFAGFHLFLIASTQIHQLYDKITIKKYLIAIIIILYAPSIYISTQIQVKLIIPMLIYTSLLIILLISSIGLSNVYYRNNQLLDARLKWIDLNPKMYKPYLFLFGVILFIVSDIFVLNQLLNIIKIPPIGLPVYWFSLFIIFHSFIQDHPISVNELPFIN